MKVRDVQAAMMGFSPEDEVFFGIDNFGDRYFEVNGKNIYDFVTDTLVV